MSHPYFFVDKNSINPDFVSITGEDFSHLVRVLRARVGDVVEVSDNETKRYKTVLAEIKKDAALLQVKQVHTITKKSFRVSLFMCLLKKEAMEFAIQKTAEIGVDRIIPVLSARSVVELDGKKIKNKVFRWQQIATGASKQCKRDFICEIAAPIDAGIIDIAGYNIFFLPVEDLFQYQGGVFMPGPKDNASGSLKGIAKVLYDKADASSGRTILEIAYIIGPEGGFEKEEVLDMVKNGAVPVNFGTNILRAETASIYFLSIIDYLLKAR